MQNYTSFKKYKNFFSFFLGYMLYNIFCPFSSLRFLSEKFCPDSPQVLHEGVWTIFPICFSEKWMLVWLLSRV